MSESGYTREEDLDLSLDLATFCYQVGDFLRADGDRDRGNEEVISTLSRATRARVLAAIPKVTASWGRDVDTSRWTVQEITGLLERGEVMQFRYIGVTTALRDALARV